MGGRSYTCGLAIYSNSGTVQLRPQPTLTMKNLIFVKIIATALLFTSCETVQNVQQWLGTPANVQAEIILLGSAAKSHISPAVQAKIHQGAIYLNQAADLDLNVFYQFLPATTGSENGDKLIAKAKEFLAEAVKKYGSHNATTLAYSHAVANGLLANF